MLASASEILDAMSDSPYSIQWLDYTEAWDSYLRHSGFVTVQVLTPAVFPFHSDIFECRLTCAEKRDFTHGQTSCVRLYRFKVVGRVADKSRPFAVLPLQ